MVRVAVAYGGGERFYLGHAGDPDEVGRVVVIYDDGEEGLAEGSWVTGVAPAVAGSVGIGARVMAQFEEGSPEWYWGTVGGVGVGGAECDVKYLDSFPRVWEMRETTPPFFLLPSFPYLASPRCM